MKFTRAPLVEMGWYHLFEVDFKK